MSMEAFAPVDAGTVEIDVSSSTGNIKVGEFTAGSLVAVRVMNNGSATVWIRAGDSTVVSTTSRLPVGPGVCEVLRFKSPATGVLYIAAIAAGSTGKIYFTPGDGI